MDYSRMMAVVHNPRTTCKGLKRILVIADESNVSVEKYLKLVCEVYKHENLGFDIEIEDLISETLEAYACFSCTVEGIRVIGEHSGMRGFFDELSHYQGYEAWEDFLCDYASRFEEDEEEEEGEFDEDDMAWANEMFWELYNECNPWDD